MISGVGDIPQSHGRLDLSIGDDDHNVRIGRKGVNVRLESGIADLHGLELGLCFTATQFELLDDITNLFKPMSIVLFHCRRLRNDKKGRAFKKHDFGRLADLTKGL